MPGNMNKWDSRHRKIAKSGHRVAAEMIPFHRQWHGGMISANLEAIWGMSAQCFETALRDGASRLLSMRRKALVTIHLPPEHDG